MKQTISKPNRRSSGYEALNDVVNHMNQNKGASDPTIEIVTPFNVTKKLGNRLSQSTANDYIFEGIKAEKAIDEIIQREGNPVTGGGSFEFHFFRLVSKYDGNNEADLDTVYLQVFEQGFMTSNGSDFTNVAQFTLTKELLENTARSNTLELDSDLDTETGTNLLAIGDRFSGSYPKDFSVYQGEKEYYTSAQLWESGRSYSEGNLVQFDAGVQGKPETYECVQDNIASGANDPTNVAFWIQRFFSTSAVIPWSIGLSVNENEIYNHNNIGYKALQTHTSSPANEPPNSDFWIRVSWAPTYEYSPLTKGNSGLQYWVNAMGGSKHAATNNQRTAMITPDVIVRDTNHPRTWVDVFTNDPATIPAYLLVSGQPIDTLRCLAVNVLTATTAEPSAVGLWATDQFGTGAGNDPFGNPYEGNIVEYVSADGPGNGRWVVANLGPNGAAKLVDGQEIYDYDEGLSWIRGPNTTALWEQGAYYIAGAIAVFTVGAQFECVHQIAYDTGAGKINMGNTKINNDDADSDSALFVVMEPIPLAIPGPIIPTRVLGFNFAYPWPRNSNNIPAGSVSIGEQITLEQFDLDNMHLTHNRTREWFGPDVEDYFPIQGYAFEQEIEQLQQLYGVGGLALRGDYPMAVWHADRSDNVQIMDYVHFHNGQPETKMASLANAKTFRAVPGFSTLIPAQDVELTDIFDKRSVVRGGLYTKESYDTQNRYNNDNPLKDSTRLRMFLDSFRMVKPLTATNVEEPNAKPERNIEPQKLLYEKIVSYSQLKNYVLAISNVFGFKIDRYYVDTPGRGTVKYGDPVKYFDPEGINETLTDSSGTFPNTVKATATKIIYSFSKTPDGAGGFLRSVDLMTRLYPE